MDNHQDVMVEFTLLEEFFNEICFKFIAVSASYYRKDYLTHIKIDKTKAHRKKIMEKKQKLENKKKYEICSDKSNGKKKDLQLLCEAYEIPVLTKHTKENMNDSLVTAIIECDNMLTPQVFNDQSQPEDTSEPIPQSSLTSSSTSDKGKGKRTKSKQSKSTKKNKNWQALMKILQIVVLFVKNVMIIHPTGYAVTIAISGFMEAAWEL
ncbi:LOW QUALITY PROTEIN: hypothetical protein MAR_021827 [Mya arenaria]|uniref:Uncharacterized protein n=1 Tax=Mya arenaria TaxID=6604 RepID=A0ABY7ECL6_MYAAR|nr:LOW QUALITY PROTEIN: hypothetical protein MAR_021827 [Mya arenaria]